MSSNFLRNGSKSFHSIRNLLLQRHSIADSAKAPILHRQLQQQQQQSRVYARFPHSFCPKTRALERYSSTTFSSSFSSTVSSSPKIGIVGWYLGMVKSRPILTKSITCAFIYTSADFSSQTVGLNLNRGLGVNAFGKLLLIGAIGS
ncbi:uncharacterized protein LOC114316049 [Camellia sinensis]|uniref:uncharacterized protein LOC114316049 n=1 Tax=Camellia sinensis TaxID=4442 RepID=UPI001036A105|nr:uncharacterized protein LOC114316049 [Camellia sinensis]